LHIGRIIEGLGENAVSSLIDPRLAQIALAAAQTPLLDVRQVSRVAGCGVCARVLTVRTIQ
jgi:hypothetical protein